MEKTEGIQITGTGENGNICDTSVLDEHNVAYDPAQMTLDLTAAEKRRTTALLLAIQAYDKLIIKDAEYLKEMYNQSRQNEGCVIRPATMDAMVRAAVQFDLFISGRMEQIASATLNRVREEETE